MPKVIKSSTSPKKWLFKGKVHNKHEPRSTSYSPTSGVTIEWKSGQNAKASRSEGVSALRKSHAQEDYNINYYTNR